uniref:Uncharacterized protein n=1 Tax=Siphoviridae sp. ctMOb8 TaxID=2825460 RepID=A0A8S5Q053_9CAUD|nr:MAG TPA: hypothetical protein [Siphoviridae sp. ctMOb8]
MIYRAITFHFYSFETWISTASAAALRSLGWYLLK